MIVYRDAVAADGPALDVFARAIWVATFGHASAPADAAAYLDTAYGPAGQLRRDLRDGAVSFYLACATMRSWAMRSSIRPGCPTRRRMRCS